MAEHRYRVLAVDDEQDVLDVLQRALEDEYEVFTALSGSEALEILKREPMDMLITDQRMPVMSGIKLIEKSKKINPGMVRIILTGYTEPADLIDAINRGEVYRYITKPWDLNELLITIRNGLEAYQLRKDKERLLGDLQLRLNSMTVFLDLSKEAARAQSYEEIIQAVVKYLPYIVEFDVCASLIEQEHGKALLNIHCRKPVHEKLLFGVRADMTAAYAKSSGQQIPENSLLIHLTGERTRPEEPKTGFRSSVEVMLKSEGEPTGLIRLLAFKEDVFREDTRQLLDILANQTGEIVRGLKSQLIAERQRLELMVQSLADGVIMVDDQDKVFVINPAARQLLHLSPDTPVNARYLKDTLGFYPFELVRGWTAQEGSFVKEEIKVFDRVLHSLVSPVTIGERLLGVAVVLRDITEEKRLEERKEEFVSIVSHELRTPLTSIGGALDLLLNRFVGEVNPKQERYLQLAKGSCEKLNMIIDELLDLSRFEKGKMTMDMRALDLAKLVSEAAEAYQAAAQEKGVKLEIGVPQGGVRVVGDRNRLHQVLNNLLSNGLKFTDLGKTIRVDVFTSEAMSGLVGVAVFNDGEEIEEQDHERIFDKFEQAKRARGAVSGSGLGLSISKNIVEAHNGRIWVESGRGEGTHFIFTLPLQTGEEPDEEVVEKEIATGERRPAPGFKTPPRILVVDDDTTVTYVIKGALMAYGHSVLVANNGGNALRLARERHPDLIIMDIIMPDVDGLEITDILQHDPQTREIPVLVLSVAKSAEEAYQAGASAYLPKPVRMDQLLETVNQLLMARRLVKRMYNVLIVDDDPAICAVCREVLEKQGYAVVEAASGAEAMDQINKSTFDLVLLDVMLPDFDGFQVTEKIRANRGLQDLPIIFISARGKTTDKVHALKLGADDYMVKPFDALELGARVDTVIKRKEREVDQSPTTKLPGSVALERELNRRLVGGRRFALCYLDLDNLKAYNDYYGYAKADGVIQQTGDLIRKAVEKLGSSNDFVGHIAGDDFVLVTEPKRLEAIGNEIIANFDRVIPLYYHQEDQQKGYIEAEDRFGENRRFPIMGISLAAIHVSPGEYRTHSEIATKAAAVKKRAKSVEGSILVQEGSAEEAAPIQ